MASSIILSSAAGNINFSPGAGTGYSIAMNDVTGQHWTPGVPPGVTLFQGGPPFTSVRLPFDTTYDIVTDTIPIRIAGANHNAIVTLLRALRRALTSRRGEDFPMLKFQPDGATVPVYFTVYHGSVQENPRFINVEAERNVLRAIMTIQRSAVGALSTTTSSFSLQQFTNNGGASPPNYTAHGASLAGDLSYDGQPITLTTTTSLPATGIQRLYLGTLESAPTFSDVADAISTTSPTGVTVGSLLNVTHSGRVDVRYRCIAVIASPTANLQVRITVYFGTSGTGSGATIYQSAWITQAAVSNSYVDFGEWGVAEYFQTGATVSMRIQVEARSTDGLTATGTVDYLEFLPVLSWCRLTSTTSVNNAALLQIQMTRTVSYSGVGGQRMLQSPLVAWQRTNAPLDFPEVRGTLPFAAEGRFLYAAWQSAGNHSKTATLTFNCDYCPLYMSMGGAG